MAVPHLQFGTKNVVLRAEFDLWLVNLLPHNLKTALQGSSIESPEWAEPIRIVVDLFQYSDVPANALKAIALYEDQDCTLD